ncbi:MAG: Gfo/Idh/MocA family oxidoreductase, partial [Ruminococcaceae bacterium]|nr:Gfo/Idh/MocA family oxidoreductase [Oscillospiraceae bacterium]
MNNTIRVGVIGIGNMGTAHAACLQKGAVDGLSLAAVCDCNPQKRAVCVEKFPSVPFFDDWQQLIAAKAVDAVIIATPHRFHAHIAQAALEAGLHVMCEKPVDITVSAARRLNEAAAKSDRVFGIMFNQRTNPLFAKARELVQSGAIGEIKRTNWLITNWYRTQAYYDSGDWRATWAGEGGGVLLNQA